MLAVGKDVSSYVSITAASRLPSRVPNCPGPVKITFNNIDEKAKVLKYKMSLKNYSRVFIKPCKTYAERLIEHNAHALICGLPAGHNLSVDSRGRITDRSHSDTNMTDNPRQGNTSDI